MQKRKVFGILGMALLLGALAGSAGVAQDTSLETMVKMAEFKEEILYELGMWRAEMAEGLMNAIEVRALKTSIEELKVEVSLAKEMAASARIQADQAIRETRELAKQTQQKTDMIMAKVDETIRRVRNLERGLGEKASIKLKSTGLYEVKAENIYEVKKGDSLWRIAGSEDVYNDSEKWRKIYDANKDKIGAAGQIYPGQKLVIPAE